MRLTSKLAGCSVLDCPTRGFLLSPSSELQIAPPRLNIGWDVFCWIGHRRFARDWNIGQIRLELLERYAVSLSDDSIERYVTRYASMLAERERDPGHLQKAYGDTRGLILTIDGLQPEKGHETLYVVRELTLGRVLFAEPLLSSAASEITRLLVGAREFARVICKPILAWMSDKQDAFVSGIAEVFPDVPHRLCANHFLRDAAKLVLESDSRAKVQMRRKVRGLRSIERQVLAQQKEASSAPPSDIEPSMLLSPTASQAVIEIPSHAPVPTAPGNAVNASVAPTYKAPTGAPAVVLDYCAAIRGILNNDQGGPLYPPGIRMADALGEVRSSLMRLTDIPAVNIERQLLSQLVGCVDAGIRLVQCDLKIVREHAQILGKVQACLVSSDKQTSDQRKAVFEKLAGTLQHDNDPTLIHMGKTMASFSSGLFAGGDNPDLPFDNLDLERAFKHPKRHCRRIHGRAHAGSGLVQSGATLLHALDAHRRHPDCFSTIELLPYRNAKPPACQRDALRRRTVMRKARSSKKRSLLLESLEIRYLDALDRAPPSS